MKKKALVCRSVSVFACVRVRESMREQEMKGGENEREEEEERQ